MEVMYSRINVVIFFEPVSELLDAEEIYFPICIKIR